ncbi:MAG: type II toxin-antitoxin system HicA family toxin [Methanothrix sp.]|nr:type II toxin-antitoxin system HicA family toxin [Methanothrix sp.]
MGFVLKKVTGSHCIFAKAETKRRVTVPLARYQIRDSPSRNGDLL